MNTSTGAELWLMWTCEVFGDRQENSTVDIIIWLTSDTMAGKHETTSQLTSSGLVVVTKMQLPEQMIELELSE